MNEYPEIGERIKSFALENFGSLSEFCSKMEISLQTIYPYINGKSLPGTKLLIKLQNLGCSIDWLLSGIESKEKIKLEAVKKLMEE